MVAMTRKRPAALAKADTFGRHRRQVWPAVICK